MDRIESSSQCTAECAECPAFGEGADTGPDAAAAMQGGGLSRAAAAYFLLPVGLGITGAALGGAGHLGQLLGGATGLGAGMALVAFAARLKGAARTRSRPVPRPRMHREEA